MDLHLEKLISDSPAVLIDFYADWCEPCKWIEPILVDVEKHFGSKIKFSKVDIDEYGDLAKSLHILSVPTLVLFVNKKEVWRIRGFDTSPVLIKSIQKFVH